MYTNPGKEIGVYHTVEGKKVVIVPAPRFLGLQLKDGVPEAVKYPDHRYYTKSDYRLYYDLKGLNKEDFDHHNPDWVIYVLKDGTLLQADKDVFEQSKLGSNNACSDGRACYNHDVCKLKVIDKLP
jgi:hypothetical protein